MTRPNQNQHRIPRVYLKLWSFREQKTNAETLCVIKKEDPVSHYKRVKKFTTVQNLFDTTIFDKGYERYFDDKCKVAETNFPKVITALQNNSYDGQTRIYLTEFVSNLFVRQQSTFDFFTQITESKHLRRKLLREISILETSNDPKLIEAVFEEIAIDPEHTIESKVSAIIAQAWKHFNTAFGRFKHSIFKAPENRHWYTTDNPVIVIGLGKDGWIVGAEAEVYFPISKEYLLFMHIGEHKKQNPLTTFSDDEVTLVSLEVFDEIMMNVIIKSSPDYVIMGDDIGYYNARTDAFQDGYRPGNA